MAVDISVRVRNLGDVPVDSAVVEVFYESTPWDLTDDDDGHLKDEGYDESFTGSLVKIADAKVSIGPYPETALVTVSWDIPRDLTPCDYPIVVRFRDLAIDSVDPNSGEPYEEVVIGNNHGPDQGRKMAVRR